MNTIGTKSFHPKNKDEWREWLKQNHASENAVWLIYNKAKSGMPSLKHSEAIDHALCFGWIDSKGQSIDRQTYRVFFTKRKPKSAWSKMNKQKVKELSEQGLMTEAGFASIEVARQNGSWALLDDAEALIIPEALQKAFDKNHEAKNYFDSLSRTDKRNILQWLALAKRDETREKRIDEIVTLAGQNKKPKQFS